MDELWKPYQPYPEPSHPEKKPPPTDVGPIRIRHPSYPDTCNTLLKFWSFDGQGAHHETVRIACAIVANNTWAGYLSTDKGGNDTVTEQPDAVLKGKTYYFHIAPPSNGEVVDYPIIPTFEQWPFPSTLPDSWTGIPQFPQDTQPLRESCCSLSRCDYSVENAHLIPAVEKEWFNKNSMFDYINSTGIDKMKHANNTIRLRSDIHTAFDDKRFAIVPINQRLVAYCLNTHPGSHVERLYHGVEVHRLSVPPQLLFARVAYTIFENLRDFLDARVERQLYVRIGHTWATEACDVERCQQFSRATASQGKSRSSSPKKRSRIQDMDELEDSDWSDEEEWRGRKRRRTNESMELPSTDETSISYLSGDQSAATPTDPYHRFISRLVAKV